MPERPVLEEHTLLLLRRPPDAPDISDERAEELQAHHLAFLQQKRQEGVMAAAGPFRGQPDERWRGLCLYLVPPERALELAKDDPLVQAGRLTVDAWTWFTRPGELGVPPSG